MTPKQLAEVKNAARKEQMSVGEYIRFILKKTYENTN